MSVIATKHSCFMNKCQKIDCAAWYDSWLMGGFWIGTIRHDRSRGAGSVVISWGWSRLHTLINIRQYTSLNELCIVRLALETNSIAKLICTISML